MSAPTTTRAPTAPSSAYRDATRPAARPAPRLRSAGQRGLDFITFPVRALTLFHHDAMGLSCLATERFDEVARECRGYTLDIGCGYHNRFISHHLREYGKGIDLFKYEGLTDEHVVESLAEFPFADGTFDTVTFIANINHCPRPQRDQEIAEAFRVLTPGGTIVVTMGSVLAEMLVHKVVWVYDKILGTKVDMDSERGMEEDEEYHITREEIEERLTKAGFVHLRRRMFWTQWGMNALYVGEKPRGVGVGVEVK